MLGSGPSATALVAEAAAAGGDKLFVDGLRAGQGAERVWPAAGGAESVRELITCLAPDQRAIVLLGFPRWIRRNGGCGKGSPVSMVVSRSLVICFALRRVFVPHCWMNI